MESKSTRILRQRKALKLSQSELASKVGVSRVAIGNWESDPDVEIGGEKLLNLADALGISPHYIVFGKEKAPIDVDLESMRNHVVEGLFDLVISSDISIKKGTDPKDLANFLLNKFVVLPKSINSDSELSSKKV